jgi:CDP-diacylglycerol--serine O-phosphatidyltransferase
MLEEEADGQGRRRRRRGRRRKRVDAASDSRGFASLLPQLLTTGNLAAGFYAIVKASGGDVVLASYAIFVAAVFDILDGRAARMTGNVSRFGAEYDSIADTVSFGVAPAVLAFHAGSFVSLGWAGWVMAFIYTACASLRLARFNVSSGRYHGRFDGLPTPAAAGMVVSAVWFKNFLVGPEVGLGLPSLVPALGVTSLGLLMVSPIPYHSFKYVRFGQTYSATVIPVIISIALMLEPGLNFFLVGLAYVVSGPAGLLYRWRTGRELIRVDPDGLSFGANEQGSGTRAEGGDDDSGAGSGRASGADTNPDPGVTAIASRRRSAPDPERGSEGMR